MRGDLILGEYVPSSAEYLEIIERSRSMPEGQFQGFYHLNKPIDKYVVRERIPDALAADLTLWDEAEFLTVANKLACVPNVYYATSDGNIQLHQRIEGKTLDEIYPRWTPLPPEYLEQIANFSYLMRYICLDDLPPLPADWPSDGDCAGFALRPFRITETLFQQSQPIHGAWWRSLGIPPQPFEPLQLDQLAERVFSLLHSDIHRKNIIVDRDDKLWLIDWELALWGDPLYELATHLHKMKYPQEQEEKVRLLWQEATGFDQITEDLQRYREHEIIKSTMTDSLRCLDLLDQQLEPGAVAQQLYAILEPAWYIWGQQPLPTDEVEQALRDHHAQLTRIT